MTLDEGAAAVQLAGRAEPLAPRSASRRGSARRPSIDVAERAELGLGEQDRRALVGEPAHVQRLVVLGAPGPRHEDRRRAGDGDLGDRARPAAPDQQVGGGVDQLDAVVVADDLVEHAVAAVARRRRGGEEPVADDLADGQRRRRRRGSAT